MIRIKACMLHLNLIMARTPLMQRLLRLTSIAQQATIENRNVTEFAEEKFYSRRNFIESTAKAALAVTALASCNKIVDYKADDESSVNNVLGKDASIVIVGGGIAGLNAAYTLKKAGISSTVYDANTRAGGRMFTAHNILNAGLSTELGGEFIDSDHYDMRTLAEEFNLPLLDLYSPEELQLQQNIYYFNNSFYNDTNFLHAISYHLPAINRDVNSLSDSITYNSYSPTDAKFDSMNLEQYFDSINLTGWLRELLLVAYLGEYGLNTDECNAINFLFLFGLGPNNKPALYGSSDERFKVSGGNQRIVDALYNKLKNNINLNHKLVKIESYLTGYKLYFENKPKAVKADAVLLTLPFTLLREVEINIDLPQVKRNAINNLGYGTNSKLLLGFNGRRWRTQYNSVGMSYSDNTTQNTWDNSQLQPGKNGGLTVYLGGDDGIALADGSVNQQAAKYLDKLNQIYPGLTNDFNGKTQRMVWPKFPLAKGSYSAWTVGQYTTIAGSEIETVGNLYFAGEHTSYNFQGYMNGGAATGRIAARKILRNLNGQNLVAEPPIAIAEH